jgi:phosphocarrier protein HPr
MQTQPIKKLKANFNQIVYSDKNMKINIAKNFAKGTFIVINDKGLHTRPSTELVKCAASYKSQVILRYQKEVVNAKSLLGILMLAAVRGSKIDVEAVGDDAEAAVQGILHLAQNRFNINY